MVLKRMCAVVLAAAWAAAGCGPEATRLVVGEVEYSAGDGSVEGNMYATPDGRVLLTWLEPVGQGRHTLRVAVRETGRWSDPKTIVESDRFFVNWADFPSVVELSDGSRLAHWLEKSVGGTYAYGVKLALSQDGGATWSGSITPHRDESATEHGFVSMVPWEDGAALVWLDGRAMRTDADAGEQEEGGELDLGEMSVRATTIGSDGVLGPDVLLDSRTCECCQTALARTSDGLLAAYRDRSESEIRNIAVVRLVDGTWTEPRHVADDNWYYPGCPVNGPQLSARGNTVVIAWFTAPEHEPAVYAAFSYDGGASFSPAMRVDDGDPLGRVDVEMLDDGSAVITWLERSEAAAEVRVRLVHPDGTSGASQMVAETSEARASGFPRMARAGDGVVVAWTSVGDDGGVKVVSVHTLSGDGGL